MKFHVPLKYVAIIGIAPEQGRFVMVVLSLQLFDTNRKVWSLEVVCGYVKSTG